MQVDYLIVGQGIAGSLLALNLLERGRTVLVIDDGHKTAASKVAAGMINPITGRRMALTWRFLQAWNYLCDDYRKWELILGSSLFYRKSILRLFQSDEGRDRWERKHREGEFAGIGFRHGNCRPSIEGLKPSLGNFEVEQSGYVDQPTLIEAVRRYLKSRGSLAEDTWKKGDFARSSKAVKWKQWKARKIVFTQGFRNGSNPFFRDLPFRNSRGEILVLSGTKPNTQKILNRGKWLIPRHEGNFWAGATYDLLTRISHISSTALRNDGTGADFPGFGTLQGVDPASPPNLHETHSSTRPPFARDEFCEISGLNVNREPTEAGREEILSGLKEMGNWEFVVERHRAGIRPALHDFRPVLGLHPWYPEIGIFNGLGSKGSLWAPLLARELTDHLEGGKPLHPQADIERFRKYL